MSCDFHNRAASHNEKNGVLIRILADNLAELDEPTDIREPYGGRICETLRLRPAPQYCLFASMCPDNPWRQLSLDDLASKSDPTFAVLRTRQDDSHRINMQ